MSVLGNSLLIRPKLLPSNVSGMVIENQDCPLILCLAMTVRPTGAAHVDFREGLGFSKCISAGIHRIRQDRQNRVIKGKLPVDPTILIPVAECRQRDSFFAKP